MSGAYVNLEYHGNNALDCQGGAQNANGTCTNGNRPDTTLYWVAGGISKNWTGLGNTTLFGQWGRVDDPITGVLNALSGATGTFTVGLGHQNALVTNSEGKLWGLGVVQNIDAAAMELYLSYVRVSADINLTGGTTLVGGTCSLTVTTGCASGGNNPDINDMWSVMAGARIRF